MFIILNKIQYFTDLNAEVKGFITEVLECNISLNLRWLKTFWSRKDTRAQTVLNVKIDKFVLPEFRIFFFQQKINQNFFSHLKLSEMLRSWASVINLFISVINSAK